MAVIAAEISREEAGDTPRTSVVAELNAEVARLLQERAALRVTDDAAIHRIRVVYGDKVRAAMETASQSPPEWQPG
ncbi:hypothetical protein QTI27_38010 [Variovorax sp. J31P216]|nr:hypothetical protein [Variovorax sp. J31P216]